MIPVPKTPVFPFYTPSPAHYLFGKKSTSSPANSTPRKFLRRPPSPAKHIKAVLLRRKGGVKGVDDEEDWGGLDKSFGFSKEFKNCYEVGEEVGRGHFGYTCAAKCLKGELKGQQVAVKIIPKPKMTTAIAIEDVRREVKILKGLKGHENLAQLIDAFEDKDNVYIVMELCEGGELLDRILARGGKYLEDDAKAIMGQILKVVAFCHLQGVVHRDLKPEDTDNGGYRRRPGNISEVTVFVPGLRIPKPVDIPQSLGDHLSKTLVERLSALRNRIVVMASHDGPIITRTRRRSTSQHGRSIMGDLIQALNDYLPVLLELVKNGSPLQNKVHFVWVNQEDDAEETAMSSAWYEVLSVLHLMAALSFLQANLLLLPRMSIDSYLPKVSEENRRSSIDIFLKAAGYLDCAVRHILPNLPPELRRDLPVDLAEGVLRALCLQALGQALSKTLTPADVQ